MTKDEAIRISQGLISDFKCDSEIMVDYCNTVINALEQEPCEDAISRRAVTEVLLKYAHSEVGKAFAEFLVSQINDLPPVTPQYTDAEIQKMQDLESVEIQTAYEIGKAEGSEVLDKIRAEIEQTRKIYLDMNDIDWLNGCDYVLSVIDKYKASPTGAERSE